MKMIVMFFAVVALTACDNARDAVHPAGARSTASSTMPPARGGKCVDSVLLDDKCTKDWYLCSDIRSTCDRQWDDCCRATSAK